VLLEDQDRSLWDREQVAEGGRLLERGLRHGRPGQYLIQAAIAGEHARGRTDWARVAALYALLAELRPSPVVELNRAVAVAMAAGPERGLELIDAIEGLDEYHLLHSARADLMRRLGRDEEAREAYRRALRLTSNAAERAFIERRLAGERRSG
jgi:RNA polymerase sigma-70 factor (ECF subfamily)